MHDLSAFFKAKADTHSFLTTPRRCPSLMLPHSIQIEGKRTIFLAEGDKIKVEYGRLVECDTPTHEIKEVYASAVGGYGWLVAINLESQKEEIIKL